MRFLPSLARVMRAGTFAVVFSLLFASVVMGRASAAPFIDPDAPTWTPGTQPINAEKLGEEELLQRDIAFSTRRTAGDVPLSNEDAGHSRASAARAGDVKRQEGEQGKQGQQGHQDLPGPITFQSGWSPLGPDPIVQISRTPDGGGFTTMSGRIGALAIRPSNGKFILGGAQGGIWLFDAVTGTWSPKTDNLPSLSIGALAIAPSNDKIVYAGTGEGALSGDSYFGNGILRSTDGGETWKHVSDDYFEAVSISALVVDPSDANHLYVSVLRGRGGARRTTPTDHSRFGIWESRNGGEKWKLLKEAKLESNGATDIAIDPRNPRNLYASFWGDAIYKSTDGGDHWAPIMNGLPAGADFAALPSRFSIAISHPAGKGAVLYAGFDWVDAKGVDHPARVFKSTNEGALWTMLPAGTGDDKVEDYCGGQCWYDNVIEVDPGNTNIVYAAGQFDYGIGSGGIFRSDDGGTTWKNLGWDQHPDFHALAFDTKNPAHILIGSDGGVWYSADRGGRLNATDPLDAVTWQSLNGEIDRDTGAVGNRSGLQIAQFTSIATVPTNTARFWGGTQDNGTPRKSTVSSSWFDVDSGDGGQVLVDPTNSNYVYGTYFGITPYRFTNGGGSFFSNQFIRQGINLGDRSDFYVPFVMNKMNPNQLFLGTYRLYRTDNAKASSAGAVHWSAISPDLTSGCTGTAPNGARNCTLSAIGVGGGQAVYVGSLDGLVYLSTDAQTSATPTWKRVDNKLPRRPVTQIAVDPSNYRIAYIAYAGFNAATPSRRGHVFKTTNGGSSWQDISDDLPDSPVNSIVLDPAYTDTLYVGTDVGPFVSYNNGEDWRSLGKGFPVVTIWQLDLDPSHRLLAAGTHGRGAFSTTDKAANASAALVLSKTDTGKPVGPGSNITYTVTLRNIGNAPATNVTITDPIPDNTTFVSAADGGTYSRGKVTWTDATLPAGGTATVHFTVKIDATLSSRTTSIVNDGMKATSAEGRFTTGSPFVTPIAPAYAVKLAPATQTDGGRNGTNVDYKVTLTNFGFKDDSYAMSASGMTTGWTATFLDATCTTALTTTATVASGASTTVCVRIGVPAGVANGTVNTATVKATSTGNPAVSATGTIKTIAVAVATLLVDNDGNGPDVQAIYTAALTGAGVSFSTWDLSTDPNLPTHFVSSFSNVVWFSGNSYPGPITPYEPQLKAFLDGGGRLFMNGQDILDQGAGTTAFVHDYLHILWDGSETQNDKVTAMVHGVATSPVTGAAPAIGAVPLDHNVLGADFEDRITPINGALPEFTDDTSAADALSFSGAYKVVFLAFPLEAYGTAAQKIDLVKRVMTFFGP